MRSLEREWDGCFHFIPAIKTGSVRRALLSILSSVQCWLQESDVLEGLPPGRCCQVGLAANPLVRSLSYVFLHFFATSLSSLGFELAKGGKLRMRPHDICKWKARWSLANPSGQQPGSDRSFQWKVTSFPEAYVSRPMESLSVANFESTKWTIMRVANSST